MEIPSSVFGGLYGFLGILQCIRTQGEFIRSYCSNDIRNCLLRKWNKNHGKLNYSIYFLF